MKRQAQTAISHEEAARQNEIILRLKDRLKDESLTYFITTFGCQMNAHDSEKLKGILEQIGYVEAENELVADFVIYNTCAVRENAEQRVYGRIGHLKSAKRKNPNMIIALCGCMMQQATVITELKKRNISILILCLVPITYTRWQNSLKQGLRPIIRSMTFGKPTKRLSKIFQA